MISKEMWQSSCLRRQGNVNTFEPGRLPVRRIAWQVNLSRSTTHHTLHDLISYGITVGHEFLINRRAYILLVEVFLRYFCSEAWFNLDGYVNTQKYQLRKHKFLMNSYRQIYTRKNWHMNQNFKEKIISLIFMFCKCCMLSWHNLGLYS